VVSLVLRGALTGARVTALHRDSEHKRWSDSVLGPLRAERDAMASAGREERVRYAEEMQRYLTATAARQRELNDQLSANMQAPASRRPSYAAGPPPERPRPGSGLLDRAYLDQLAVWLDDLHAEGELDDHLLNSS
jgi:hypothetical protein